MSPDNGELEFIAPPEAPVFEPTEEEFKDPLAYIAKIRPFAIKTGICKIRPPPDWQPSFSVDVEKFHFTPRIQRLNELEAKSRVKLNFLDAIAKFWELQGSTLKLPTVEKKPLDLYALHKSVQEEGGYEEVVLKRKWARVSQRMGFPHGKSVSALRVHYEKILFPYDVFLSGAMTGEVTSIPPAIVPVAKEDEGDDYVPSGNSDSEPDDDIQGITRASKKHRKRESPEDDDLIDYSKNTELKKLRFLAPGPKMMGPPVIKSELKYDEQPYGDQLLTGVSAYEEKIESKETPELTRRRTSRVTKDKKLHYSVAFIDDYKCQVCDRGDSEESMLLCDNCDSSYHTFCLIPPLNSVPPGDWRCPKCVAKECKKPQEAYGFEQAKKVYNLREFGVMADRFKEDYFSMPPHEVPTPVVEREFWRLVNSLDDDVVVEYGADLHTAEHGSGFPMETNTDDPDDEEYIKSWWNLNNLPVHDKSVLRFINANISGMKVPWLYVGMCFSSFCWHNEDHWSYSINYLHWGEPKTWYGVPGEGAEKLESCMKETAPELFDAQPDLLHHLVTILSPTTLMNYGVPVVRTNQSAGEFVVTFPRAYHAGFNQGYNCAEAVNFCPADWLSDGRQCIDHYRAMTRCPVFSHDELICKMALEAETLDLDMAKCVYFEMNSIANHEIDLRKELVDLGFVETLKVEFELLPDDEKQCKICRTTCFLSAVVCHCNKDRLVCLNHAKDLCKCLASKKSIRYRYKIPEMQGMVAELKKRADLFDNWKKDVEFILRPSSALKEDFVQLKELMVVAITNKFPSCTSIDGLKSAISEAEQCSQVATQLFIKKHKTRNSHSQSLSQSPRVSLQELEDFVTQMNNLRCIIKEARLVEALLSKVKNFQYEAQCVINDPGYDMDRINELLGHGATLDVELPEITQLEQCLTTAKWLQDVDECLKSKVLVDLSYVRSLVNQGASCSIKEGSGKVLSTIKELLFVSERWEEKAKLCLQAKPRHMGNTLEAIVQEASKVNVMLPNVNLLKEALKATKEWTEKVEKIQNLKPYPDFDLLEALVLRARPFPVRLDQLPQMESQVAAARAWRDRTVRTFVRKGSTRTLLELLLPRSDIVRRFKDCSKSKKKHLQRDKDEKEKDKKDKDKERETTLEQIDIDQMLLACATPPNRASILSDRKEKESIELHAMKKLRNECRAVLKSDNPDGPFCSCRRIAEGSMIRCHLCLEWYHSSCVAFPKSINGRPILKTISPVTLSKEMKYLCPFCCRSRRPRLETVLSLIMSLQKLPVRVPEGEALQYLTERAMNWQERAKLVLCSTKIAALLTRIRDEIGDDNKDVTDKGSQSSVSTATYTAYIQKSFALNNLEDELKPITDNATSSSQEITNEQNEKTSPTVESNLLSLECSESMNGSPENEKNISLVPETTPTTPVKLNFGIDTDASRSGSPIDVVAPHIPTVVIPQVVTVSEKTPICRLADYLLDQLEELAMEGDLLEITLDETHHLWLILRDQRPLKYEDCRIMDPEHRKRLMKEKKKKKRRLENITTEKSPLTVVIPRPGKSNNSQDNQQPSPTKKKRKKEKLLNLSAGVVIKKEQAEAMIIDVIDGNSNTPSGVDVDDDEDSCAAKKCSHPIGDEVGWVQCDQCSNWYHVVCVGLTAAAADALDTYDCPPCKKQDIKTEPIPDSATSEVDGNTTLPTNKNEDTVMKSEETTPIEASVLIKEVIVESGNNEVTEPVKDLVELQKMVIEPIKQIVVELIENEAVWPIQEVIEPAEEATGLVREAAEPTTPKEEHNVDETNNVPSTTAIASVAEPTPGSSQTQSSAITSLPMDSSSKPSTPSPRLGNIFELTNTDPKVVQPLISTINDSPAVISDIRLPSVDNKILQDDKESDIESVTFDKPSDIAIVNLDKPSGIAIVNLNNPSEIEIVNLDKPSDISVPSSISDVGTTPSTHPISIFAKLGLDKSYNSQSSTSDIT